MKLLTIYCGFVILPRDELKNSSSVIPITSLLTYFLENLDVLTDLNMVSRSQDLLGHHNIFLDKRYNKIDYNMC
jgi:hypothetical protein